MNDNLITYLNSKSPVSEAYRMLRTNLHYLNIDKEHKAIVVTSANPAEGKTTTLANLAITLAMSGKKVLIVECDLRKCRVHKTFGLSNYMGLMNIIVEDKKIEEVVREIKEIPNLHVMTSGPMPPDPAEVLESNSMANLVGELKEKFDVVLFDAPPICSVTDAAILSRWVDGVLLVTASGETNVESAKLAKKLLDKVNANILGVILTKVDTSKSGGYYYYYYDDDDKKKKRNRKNKKLA